MARLSTHVLDTARGVPACGIRIELHRIEQGQRLAVADAVTNADGRTDSPLMASDRLEVGIYELTFHAGHYLRATGQPVTDPPFLEHVMIRFGVAEPDGNYHVPLLLSPYGYSTYKGS